MTKTTISYKDAGVDIDRGDAFVERIKSKVQSTYSDRVESGVGGFAALYRAGDRLLAAGTDGGGTKVKLAQELGIHNTIGIDLVAMCANDILCVGAKPLFFMDYLACGGLDLTVSEAIIDGIVAACKETGLALIGGETAEMPGVYPVGEYDLAGFAVGEVFPRDLIDGSTVSVGDVLIGFESSGFHSNGFSLVRKVIKSDEKELLMAALAPTKLYEKSIRPLIEAKLVKGLAHITGSGLLNVPRINGGFDYHITNMPTASERPWFVNEVCQRTGLPDSELFRTFNMGIGMVVATDRPEELMTLARQNGEAPRVLGEVKAGIGDVIVGVGEEAITLQ
jgi:phosphoribosylformylglycinamidine cyclo-ligase